MGINNSSIAAMFNPSAVPASSKVLKLTPGVPRGKSYDSPTLAAP